MALVGRKRGGLEEEGASVIQTAAKAPAPGRRMEASLSESHPFSPPSLLRQRSLDHAHSRLPPPATSSVAAAVASSSSEHRNPTSAPPSTSSSSSSFLRNFLEFLLRLFRPLVNIFNPRRPRSTNHTDDRRASVSSTTVELGQDRSQARAAMTSAAAHHRKENVVGLGRFTNAFSKLQVEDGQLPHPATSVQPVAVPPDVKEAAEPHDPVKEAERVVHRAFMREALAIARLALKTNETPVGCVLVHKGRIIARGMNATNITRNGTRHAELMAITALLSYTPASDTERPGDALHTDQEWGDVDPSDGHIYPYGQKLHPSPRVDPSIIAESILYVTVEPCVMCASLLRQLRIKKVYFGAVNDKFGGTGGVFKIHTNSMPVSNLPSPPRLFVQPYKPRTLLFPLRDTTNESNGKDGDPSDDMLRPAPTIAIAEGTVPPTRKGDGGNVEQGYEVEGGWGRDDAVNLLRQFYVQENGRAPVPRKKEGRAARLAAMMERDGLSTADLDLPPPPNPPSQTDSMFTNENDMPSGTDSCTDNDAADVESVSTQENQPQRASLTKKRPQVKPIIPLIYTNGDSDVPERDAPKT